MLIMNVNRTLVSQNTETLFWQRVLSSLKGDADSLKTLFSSLLLYLYTVFCQSILIYKEMIDDENFNVLY